MNGHPPPTAKEVRELLDYNLKTGEFRWRATKSGRHADRCGTIQKVKKAIRLKIVINYKTYMASRLAWLYVTGSWPTAQIDHANGNMMDNRFANLREATHAQNAKNRSVGKPIQTPAGTWRAFLGKRQVGVFPTKEEAERELRAVAKRERGKFARI